MEETAARRTKRVARSKDKSSSRTNTGGRTSPARLSSAHRKQLAERMLAWFSAEARTLPWRGTRDLYRIWVSEIMLQQTQVATVIGYYERFLARFPSVVELAAADEHEVLRLWEGLGYYRRARQLHAAAKRIVDEHAGQFPETFDEVLALPGIGRYTAGAILSIGRDLSLPILEANTVRVLSRLTALAGDTTSSDGQRFLWQTAEELLPRERIGDFNQSLMELGATICTPRSPSCLLCPASGLCAARKAGLQEQIPAAKKPPKFEEVKEAAVVVRRADGRVLLRLRKSGERWAGMWDFPRFPVVAAQDAQARRAIRDETKLLTGQTVAELEELAVIKHGVTRFRITLNVLQGTVSRATKFPTDTQFAWESLQGLGERALCMTGRKIAKMLAAEAVISRNGH